LFWSNGQQDFLEYSRYETAFNPDTNTREWLEVHRGHMFNNQSMPIYAAKWGHDIQALRYNTVNGVRRVSATLIQSYTDEVRPIVYGLAPLNVNPDGGLKVQTSSSAPVVTSTTNSTARITDTGPVTTSQTSTTTIDPTIVTSSSSTTGSTVTTVTSNTVNTATATVQNVASVNGIVTNDTGSTSTATATTTNGVTSVTSNATNTTSGLDPATVSNTAAAAAADANAAVNAVASTPVITDTLAPVDYHGVMVDPGLPATLPAPLGKAAFLYDATLAQWLAMYPQTTVITTADDYNALVDAATAYNNLQNNLTMQIAQAPADVSAGFATTVATANQYIAANGVTEVKQADALVAASLEVAKQNLAAQAQAPGSDQSLIDAAVAAGLIQPVAPAGDAPVADAPVADAPVADAPVANVPANTPDNFGNGSPDNFGNGSPDNFGNGSPDNFGNGSPDQPDNFGRSPPVTSHPTAETLAEVLAQMGVRVDPAAIVVADSLTYPVQADVIFESQTSRIYWLTANPLVTISGWDPVALVDGTTPPNLSYSQLGGYSIFRFAGGQPAPITMAELDQMFWQG